MRKLIGIIFAWIKDGLSLDETRVSLLMFSFFICMAVSVLYLVRWHCDIPTNLYGLMCVLAAILGVNTVASTSSGLLDKAITVVKSKIGI